MSAFLCVLPNQQICSRIVCNNAWMTAHRLVFQENKNSLNYSVKKYNTIICYFQKYSINNFDHNVQISSTYWLDQSCLCCWLLAQTESEPKSRGQNPINQWWSLILTVCWWLDLFYIPLWELPSIFFFNLWSFIQR